MARKDLIKYIRTDKNGTKIFHDWTCPRCGGMGEADKWMFTGRVCYDCGGTGKRATPKTVKEYTPEYEAKLQARRRAKQEKWEAEHADEIAAQKAEEARREAEEARREAERLAEIERNRGQFFGEVGEKIEIEVTFDHEFHFERPAFGRPWTTEIVKGYSFKTDEGNTAVWLTTGKSLCYTDKDGDLIFPEEGERMKIRGTIKGHREYGEVNQTELSRVKWVR